MKRTHKPVTVAMTRLLRVIATRGLPSVDGLRTATIVTLNQLLAQELAVACSGDAPIRLTPRGLAVLTANAYGPVEVGSVWSPEPPATSGLLKWKDAAAVSAFTDGYAAQRSDDPRAAGYGRACFIYAARWARAAEQLLAVALGDAEPTTEAVEAVLDSAARIADDTADMGVTGFQYGHSVKILASVWRYGEVLRRWHNRAYAPAANSVPGAVVNPAIMTVDTTKVLPS